MVFLGSVHAQDFKADHYNLLLAEAKLFEKYHPGVTLKAALIDSAQHYAQDNDLELAIIFLEEYVQRIPVETKSKNFVKPLELPNRELIIRSGVDFNRQEFELGYIESDSLIKEQISKPYIGMDLSMQLLGLQQNGIRLRASGRGDSENKSLAVKMYADYHPGDRQIYFEAGYLFDKNSVYPDFSYNEFNTKQKYGTKLPGNWNWDIQNQLRYKFYNEPSQTIPDFFRDVAHIEFSRYGINYTYNTIQYHIDYNESLHYSNNDYFEQTAQWFGRKIWPSRFMLDYTIGYQNNLFNYALEDSALFNRAESFFFQPRFDLTVTDFMHLISDYQGRYKVYSKKTEQDPDYHHHLIINKIRFTLGQNLHLETGYLFEFKNHFLFEDAQEVYINEQNYYGDGVLFGIEFFNYKRFMLSALASYTWRRYPNAASNGLSSFYNDRDVLNLNVFVQAPIFKNLSINIFASYDDDRDLDSDAGNIHHSIFSGELQYTF